MSKKILVKRSAVQGKVPTTTDLDLGEIGLNTYDGKLFIKKNDGTESVIEVGKSDPEIGGIAYNPNGVQYRQDDLVVDYGDIYICKRDHISAGDKPLSNTYYWLKYGPEAPYVPKVYNFTTDDTGCANPAPAGGPTCFKVDSGNTAHTAQVKVEGFSLRSDEFDNTVDGQITLASPVSTNTWVEITV